MAHNLFYNEQEGQHSFFSVNEKPWHGSKKMDSMHMTGNPDHDFAEMMIVHHLAAIEMAQTEIDSGKDTSIKKLAKRIIEDQTKEIEEMQQ
jgi:uncharacterized protein (DUF305 family)